MGMHYAKTQLLKDDFQYTRPTSKKHKSPPGPKSTNPSKPKRPVQKNTTVKPLRPRLTEEQIRDRQRLRAADHFQRRKELGLCRSCPNNASKGQSRCLDCAERHRGWNRQNGEKTRRAKGIGPRPRTEDSELMDVVRKEVAEQANQGAGLQPRRVRSEAYKEKQRHKQALLRAERASLGL